MSVEPRRTASICTMEVETGTHTFVIDGYNEKKSLGVGNFIRSATFTVGGFDWAIRFYPNGQSGIYKDYIVVYLELMSSNAEVRAHYHLRFVGRNPEMEGVVSWFPSGMSRIKSRDLTDGRFCPRHKGLLLRSNMELLYLQNDRLTIHCDITVFRQPTASETGVQTEIPVPPSDMVAHFCKFMEDKEGSDVTFSVAGQTFTAHKAVLAARSPVFKAELYRPTRETETGLITVQDMNPVVFRALLHFIYADILPTMFDLNGHDYIVMIRQLLVAADRYAMDRLKLLCQSILAKNLNMETVSTTLDLAQQHSCHKLRDVCIEFMASLSERDAMAATQAYAMLKGSCPSILAAVFEKRSWLRKT